MFSEEDKLRWFCEELRSRHQPRIPRPVDLLASHASDVARAWEHAPPSVRRAWLGGLEAELKELRSELEP